METDTYADEIHRELLAALTEVLRQFEAGEETSREAQATVWFKFSLAIGVDRDLLVPLQVMRTEFAERRRKTGKVRSPKPLTKAEPLVFTAAAVTVISKREKKGLSSASAEVARASGMMQKTIKDYRAEILRWNVPKDIIDRYEKAVAELERWPTDGILKESLPRLRKYVK